MFSKNVSCVLIILLLATNCFAKGGSGSGSNSGGNGGPSGGASGGGSGGSGSGSNSGSASASASSSGSSGGSSACPTGPAALDEACACGSICQKGLTCCANDANGNTCREVKNGQSCFSECECPTNSKCLKFPPATLGTCVPTLCQCEGISGNMKVCLDGITTAQGDSCLSHCQCEAGLYCSPSTQTCASCSEEGGNICGNERCPCLSSEACCPKRDSPLESICVTPQAQGGQCVSDCDCVSGLKCFNVGSPASPMMRCAKEKVECPCTTTAGTGDASCLVCLEENGVMTGGDCQADCQCDSRSICEQNVCVGCTMGTCDARCPCPTGETCLNGQCRRVVQPNDPCLATDVCTDGFKCIAESATQNRCIECDCKLSGYVGENGQWTCLEYVNPQCSCPVGTDFGPWITLFTCDNYQSSDGSPGNNFMFATNEAQAKSLISKGWYQFKFDRVFTPNPTPQSGYELYVHICDIFQADGPPGTLPQPVDFTLIGSVTESQKSPVQFVRNTMYTLPYTTADFGPIDNIQLKIDRVAPNVNQICFDAIAVRNLNTGEVRDFPVDADPTKVLWIDGGYQACGPSVDPNPCGATFTLSTADTFTVTSLSSSDMESNFNQFASLQRAVASTTADVAANLGGSPQALLRFETSCSRNTGLGLYCGTHDGCGGLSESSQFHVVKQSTDLCTWEWRQPLKYEVFVKGIRLQMRRRCAVSAAHPCWTDGTCDPLPANTCGLQSGSIFGSTPGAANAGAAARSGTTLNVGSSATVSSGAKAGAASTGGETLSPGGIVGIVLACVVAVALAAIGLRFCYKKFGMDVNNEGDINDHIGSGYHDPEDIELSDNGPAIVAAPSTVLVEGEIITA